MAVPDRLLGVAGIPGEVCRKIKNLSAALVGEPDIMESLFDIVDHQRAINRLIELPGIGRRHAEYILFRGYGFPDMLIYNKTLYLAVQKFFRMNTAPDRQTIDRLAEPFIPWRSWWMFLLQTAYQTTVII